MSLSSLAQVENPFAGAAAMLPASREEHAAAASSRLTLEDAQAAALASNPEIHLAVRRVAIAEARQPAAGALDDPTLMYRGWGIPLNSPYDFSQAQNMFMIGQNFPGPGKRALRSQVAGADITIAKAQLEAAKRDVTARVRTAFYALLRNNEELRIHDQQVGLARQAMEAARIKYTVGRVPQQDVLKAQVALTRLVDRLVTLETDGAMARATLNTLMGRDPGTPMEAVGEYAVPARLPSLVELEKTALENRPELVAASLTVQQGETRTRLAEKAYTPDYSVSGGYMLMPAGSMNRNTYSAELSMTLPWLNRRRHDAEIAEARTNTAARQADYDNQRAMVFQQIQESLIRAKAARKLVDLYQKTLRPQAEATLKATAAAYQADRTDFLNLLDSQNMSLDVDISYFRALTDFESRMAELERAVGAPIVTPEVKQ
ncbi:MAG TPA: TolC family protein [Terriglobales bacterium]|jgi:outer membrane protein TolC|nr:TolC family protein [Terriglobales bacterium]